MERKIIYYFDYIDNNRSFVDRFGHYVVYPYDKSFWMWNITVFNSDWLRRLDWISRPDWVFLYVFDPGITQDEIREIVGSRGFRLSEVVVEGYTQILFIGQSGRIIGNIHSNNKSFEFDFGEFEDRYIRLSFVESLPIELVHSESTAIEIIII